MPHQFEFSIARIRNVDGRITGAGMLIAPRYVLTCAHVVVSALDIVDDQTTAPQAEVLVDFPLVNTSQIVSAQVVLWQPPNRDGGGDIAGLELSSEAPVGANATILAMATDLWDHSFRAFGFPSSHDAGVWVTGQIKGRQSYGWIQMNSDEGYSVAPGFSGTPVWNSNLNSVVGMMVASEQSVRAAFMIPTSLLADAVPSLITNLEEDNLSKSASASRQVHWRDGLNSESLQIALDLARTLRVLAGPGTGKTFSLVRRVTRLLEDEADPEKILLVTFTRTAADDLAKELGKLNAHGIGRICSGTLHSYCFSVLRQANIFLQTGRSIQHILLEFEERFLLEDLKFSGNFGDHNARKKLLKLFEAAWAQEQDQEPGWLSDEIHRRFDISLKEWLRCHDAMLIEEIVPETLRYLRNNPVCKERNHFEHVLIDEYQDLNKAEQSLIDLLRGEGTLTVIGDEDQSIYESFRHAHPEGITHFDNTHHGTHDIPLEICRRCPNRVLDMAKNLIQNNRNRLPRNLFPRPNNIEGEVHIVQWPDMESEANGIARFVNDRIASGTFQPGEVLILCPRREFGWSIRDKLAQEHNRSVRSFFHEDELRGNPKQLANSAAQQAFTLLILAHNLADKVALRCWLGFGHADLRAEQYKRLYDYCSANNRTPRNVLDAIHSGNLSLPNIRSLVERYELLLQRLQDLSGRSARDTFDSIFPVEHTWAEPFRVFTDGLNAESELEDFIEAVRMAVTQPDLPSEVDFIRVMSLHKSKGLTADHVIVVGCIEGLIPTIPEDLSPAEESRMLEEQRRLFYVAITRPRKTLVVSSTLTLPRGLAYAMGATVIGNSRETGNTIASQFISELGPRQPSAIRGDRWQY